jgi:SpoIID/LytB domain protein
MPPRLVALIVSWIAVLPVACGRAVEPESGVGTAALPRGVRAEPARLAPAAGTAEEALPDAAAWAVIDLASGIVLDGHRTALLDVPVLPGSLMKVVALLAAADAGLVDARTRLACPRRVRVAGRTLDCVHPLLAAPLDAPHAIAHSCNGFFAAMLRRLTVGELSRAAGRLGLPPLDSGADVVLSGLGLAGPRVPLRAWAAALDRIASLADRPGEIGARLVTEGLRLAVSEGTAQAFTVEPRGWLAKTGTAPMPGGGVEGLFVAVGPGLDRAVVAMAPGAAGRDAASIGALAWRRARATVDRAPGGRRDTAGEKADSARTVPQADATIRVGRARRGGYETETLPLEAYVAAVVAGEAAAAAPGALLEALAIAARSYAIAARGRHAADGFDVCDLTHCQVVGRPGDPARLAALRTAGRVLLDGGRPIGALYTAQCGGWLESAEVVWPEAAEAMWAQGVVPRGSAAARPDPAGEPEPAWVVELPARAIEDALRAAGFRGAGLEGLHVSARTPSGRAARLALAGFAPSSTSGERFRLAIGRTLGWQHVKSTHFTVTRMATGYRFEGRGLGHGAGMCLFGAAALARRGATSGDILRAYFPDATVGPLPDELARPVAGEAARGDLAVAPSPSVLIAMPLEAEPSRQRIEALVRRAVSDVARRSGTPVPAAVRVRVHPTPESFRRATGLPWGAAGAVRDGVIVLPPLRALEDRGLLERTLRHEVAHLLTAPVLAGRPRWVLEGAAIHFAGHPFPPASSGRAAGCPPDEAFARARTLARLDALYASAHACFVRALDGGLAWRDVR